MVNEIIEEWKPVVGMEGWYEVSSTGRVRRSRPGKSTVCGKILKIRKNPFGYLKICLSLNGIQFMRLVHVLVAEAFLGPKPDGMDVNHIDGNKANSRLDNLEYVTRSGNAVHAINTGLWVKQVKLSREDVADIKRLSLFYTQTMIAEKYGIHQSQVSRILSGKRRRLTS